MTTPSRRLVGFSIVAGTWLGAMLIAAGGHMQAAGPAQQPPDPQAATTTPRATLQRYCLTCHNQNLKERGTVPIAFDTLDLSSVGTDADVWERVVRKVRTGLMPPAGRPRPDKATDEAFVSWIETQLDAAALAHPNPGRTQTFHRLNRAEYKNVIRDLLELDVDVDSLLPADDSSYGFDNIAGVLKMSPTLIERYLAAAQKISRVAVGTPPPFPNVDYVRLADDLQQDEHIEGLPVGTRGGASIPYRFPMDADYVVKVRLARDILENVPVFAEDQQLEVSLDGERVQVFTVPGFKPQPPAPKPATPEPAPVTTGASSEQGGAAAPVQGRGGRPRPGVTQVDTGPRLSAKDRQLRNHIDDSWDVRIHVKAGDRQLNVAFIKLTAAIAETPRLPFIRPYAANVNTPDNRMGVALRSVEIVGPYDPTGPGDSPGRRRIFVCEPQPGGAGAKHGGIAPGTTGGRPGTVSEETGCAKKILSTLARRAYRRPVVDADIKPLLAIYAEGRAQGSFDVGIERALDRLLVSPEFLFRVERDPANVRPNTPYRVSDLELASRLSFFLWSSIPDDELLDAATAGTLKDDAVLARQVSRMIADPRADAFVNNFAGQWLYLRNLPSAMPISFNFPDFDEALRASMQRETELFFNSIIREDRGAIDLLTANYTFLNERLARHYGIPGVKGTHFRRVTLEPDSVRMGLLGQGSILTVTSHPDRTSPVVRGKWILENILGASPPPPPPNVPELKPTGEAGTVLSMRDRMVQHRANPACAGCHAMMDPIGLSLENFDAVGQVRSLGESSEPIDASGSLPDGTKFVGATGLRNALLSKSDQIAATVTEKLLTYALGRGLEYYDEPTVRAIVRDARRQDYRFTSGLIMGVVKSAPFQMRNTKDIDTKGTKATKDAKDWSHMFVTKMSLPRRTFLRGMSTALALPLLDAMVPALSAMAATAARPVRRMGFVYLPNGVSMNFKGINYWKPVGEGTDFQFSPILAPFSPFREQMVVVSGTNQHQADVLKDGANGDHTRGTSTWLTGIHPKHTEGADVQNGVSADQIAARYLGRDTALPSLELALDLNYLAGNCENGYACVYMNTLSWSSPTTPLPTENNPRVVFERLFGDGGTSAQRLAQAHAQGSILDSVNEELKRLLGTLGPGDRTTVNDYVESVFEVERRIQAVEKNGATEVLPTLERPIGVPERFDQHVGLLYDMQWLAFRADITRVVTFMLGRELNFRTYPEIGVTEGHHGLSHHGDRPEQLAKYATVNTYQAQLFAKFLEKLRATPDGDGTLLDHSMFLYGAGLSNPNLHAHGDLPLAVFGGGIKGGRHIVAPRDTPMTNLLLTMLDRSGIPTESLGDSTGRLQIGPLAGI